MFTKLKDRYDWGKRFLSSKILQETKDKTQLELSKTPSRTKIINFTLQTFCRETQYLEIGVRNPDDNFNKIQASNKYSVDPGVEFEKNPVDFKMTSDAFFDEIRQGNILSKDIRFDVVFIDGLHAAEQVVRDIENAIAFLNDDGFILLHDCNPPTEWHAREDFDYKLTPALKFWNGTAWKAFYKYRQDTRLTSACVDTDWGVAILTKQQLFNSLQTNENEFYEYRVLDANRSTHLNLISFEQFKETIKKQTPKTRANKP